MERLTLIRHRTDDHGTAGVLTVEGRRIADTLELPWRNNQPEMSCIPPGLYDCRLKHSPRFGLVYQVCDVPGRGDILIHGLNFAGDRLRGLDTHSHGCIGLGRAGALRNTSGAMQRAVLVSRATTAQFMSALQRRPFTLEIRHDYPDSVAV